jgi:hypothetical protein
LNRLRSFPQNPRVGVLIPPSRLGVDTSTGPRLAIRQFGVGADAVIRSNSITKPPKIEGPISGGSEGTISRRLGV